MTDHYGEIARTLVASGVRLSEEAQAFVDEHLAPRPWAPGDVLDIRATESFSEGEWVVVSVGPNWLNAVSVEDGGVLSFNKEFIPRRSGEWEIPPLPDRLRVGVIIPVEDYYHDR